MKNFITYTIIMLSMMACGKNRDLEEGDRNTYTWKGTLFKGHSDNPSPNKEVWLEVDIDGISESEAEVIASGTTDQDGNFKLTYKKLRGSGQVFLNIGLSTLLSAPPNTNVSRDVAEINHSRIYLDVHFLNKAIPDTFYVELPYPINSELLKKLKFENTPVGTFHKDIFCIPREAFESDIILKCALGGKWDNPVEIRNPGIGYGLSKKEIEKVTLSGLLDSVPDDFQILPLHYRGFPYVDTITIEI